MTTLNAPANLTSAKLIEEELRPPSAWRAVLGSTQGRIGLGLAALLLFIIIFGRFFTPYAPNAILAKPLETPNAIHLLGTDSLGRDTLSRLLVGGSAIILIPIIAVSLACLSGATTGMLAAYRGGKIDASITRLFDLLLALPPLVVVLAAIAAFGPSKLVLVISIMAVYVPRMGRIARGATQGVVTSEYVAAAQARGERTAAILFREILPNVMAPITADYALRVTYGVIFVASLNFLGLGVQPPTADWGVMVSGAYQYINVDPVATLAPAAMIALLSVALNLLAEALTQHVTHGAREIVPV